MTNVMYDSVDVAALPGNGDIYAGYVNGLYANVAAIVGRFPDKPVLTIDVTGSGHAQALDVETGDATVRDIDPWLANHAIKGVVFTLPVIYMSVSVAASAFPFKHPNGCLLWTAHYSYVKHICGPHSCGLLPYDADMTQWTDNPPLNLYDTSAVNPVNLVSNNPLPPVPVSIGVSDDMIILPSKGAAVPVTWAPNAAFLFFSCEPGSGDMTAQIEWNDTTVSDVVVSFRGGRVAVPIGGYTNAVVTDTGPTAGGSDRPIAVVVA